MQPQPNCEPDRTRNTKPRSTTMHRNHRSTAVLSLSALALLFATASVTSAAVLEWTGTAGDGLFFTPGNWSPAQTPANGDDITLGAGSYAATMSSSGTLFFPDKLAVGASVTLEAKRPLRVSNNTTAGSYATSFSNAGTISFSESRQLDMRRAANVTTLANSGTIEVVDGKTLLWTFSRKMLANSGGTVRAVDGSTLRIGLEGGFTQGLTGGQLSIDATSSANIGFFDDQGNGSNGVNMRWSMSGASLNNAGSFRIRQIETSPADGNEQQTFVSFSGTGAGLNNSGSVLVENASTGVRKASTSIRLDANSSFANTGTITVSNTGSNSSVHWAYLTAVNSITNAGTIFVTRGANAGATYLAVTGAGNTFTQVHADSAVNLSGGGELRAPNVLINAGYLRGNGKVTGATVIGANAFLAPGTSVGTLEFVGNLTLSGTYELEIDKLLGTADLLSVSGVLTLDDAVLDISYWAYQPGEQSFRIASATGGIVGDFATVVSPAGYSLSLLNNGTELWLAIPEPTSLALLALGGLALRRRRRRR